MTLAQLIGHLTCVYCTVRHTAHWSLHDTPLRMFSLNTFLTPNEWGFLLTNQFATFLGASWVSSTGVQVEGFSAARRPSLQKPVASTGSQMTHISVLLSYEVKKFPDLPPKG